MTQYYVCYRTAGRSKTLIAKRTFGSFARCALLLLILPLRADDAYTPRVYQTTMTQQLDEVHVQMWVRTTWVRWVAGSIAGTMKINVLKIRTDSRYVHYSTE